jgi:hypothetical protein
MPSTPAERLLEAQRLYRDAFNNRLQDLKDAKTVAQVKSVQRNLNDAETAYINAGLAVLEGNGKAIEDAYKAAKAANDSVTKGREDAKELAERIKRVAAAISAVNGLIKAIKG